MVTLEQVKLLESKVGKTIDYVRRLSSENETLRAKLEGYRVRIDELEVLVRAFKDDQGRIEAGIISALERLNQFEDAVESSLAETAEFEAEPVLPRIKEKTEAASAYVTVKESSPEDMIEDVSPEASILSEIAEGALEEESPELPEDPEKPADSKEERSAELDIF